MNSYRYRMFSKLNIHGDVETDSSGHSSWSVQCGDVNKSVSDVFDSKAFLKTVTSQPGVYRMYDAGGTVIYVGKAKDLKKRLSSYFRSNLASRKTEALVALIQTIDVTVTHTETEALLLEHNPY